MIASTPQALSLVEHGWRGARRCSLAVAEQGIPVTHLLRGWVAADLVRLIGRHPNIRLVRVPHRAFHVSSWGWLAACTATGRLRWLLVDRERTRRMVQRWCERFEIAVVMIHDTVEGYELSVGGQSRTLADVFGLTA